MGFFDSFKTGIGAFGDFLGDITGAALGAAPTIIPLLQSTGVIPQVQPSAINTSRGPGAGPLGQSRNPYYPNYGRTALPGGAPVQPYQQNPFPGPVGFSAGLPTNQPTSPYGVVPMPSFPAQRGGFTNAAFGLPGQGLAQGFDLPFIDIVPQGQGVSGIGSPWASGRCGARAQAFLATNPTSGASTWFKPAGKPILWSGDLTACKRVGKIAARARRAKR
jgi:hypothetical protein